jgi:hypothetical protein
MRKREILGFAIVTLTACGGSELAFPRDAVLVSQKACGEEIRDLDALDFEIKTDPNRVLSGLVIKNKSESERRVTPGFFSIQSGSCRFPEARTSKGEIKGQNGGPAPTVTLKSGETMELAMSSDFGVRAYASCTTVSIAFHAEVDGASGCHALGTWVMAE